MAEESRDNGNDDLIKTKDKEQKAKIVRLNKAIDEARQYLLLIQEVNRNIKEKVDAQWS